MEWVREEREAPENVSVISIGYIVSPKEVYILCFEEENEDMAKGKEKKRTDRNNGR